MPAWRRSKKSMGEKAKKRRLIALDHLEKQIKSGKTFPDGKPFDIDLTDIDKKRIIKEMANIKKRL